MRARLALLTLTLLAVICVSAVTEEDYKPGWWESWEGEQKGVLYNFWSSLNPFLDDKNSVSPYEDADIFGWYKGTFFGLANWEREVCMLDLSSDVRNFRSVSDDIEPAIYMTTATVSAKRQTLFNGSFLYEAAWYIQPFAGDVEYAVYLTDGAAKQYLDGSATKFVKVSKAGKSDYKVNYYAANYTSAVLTFRNTDGSDLNEVQTKVVDK